MGEQRLYLRVGDRVLHQGYEEWGMGAVVEEMTSIVPGGTCLVRVLFEDGHQRTFNNDMDSDMCCYYFGVRKYLSLPFSGLRQVRRASARRLGQR